MYACVYIYIYRDIMYMYMYMYMIMYMYMSMHMCIPPFGTPVGLQHRGDQAPANQPVPYSPSGYRIIST